MRTLYANSIYLLENIFAHGLDTQEQKNFRGHSGDDYDMIVILMTTTMMMTGDTGY